MIYFPKSLYLTIVCASVLSYFVYHGIHGKHGLEASHGIQQQRDQLQADLEAIRKERETWESKVALMRPEHLDPDMLEERARATLNFAHPNDLIILEVGE